MKIVAFNGSPRKGGNTEMLIQDEDFLLFLPAFHNDPQMTVQTYC